MPRLARLVPFVLLIAVAVGCKHDQPLPVASINKDYDRPLAPGQFALRKIDPSQYPKFGDAWYAAKGVNLREAVQRSINYLKKKSSQKYYPLGPITHDQVLNSLTMFLDTLDQANSPEALDQLIRENYDVYMSIGCDDRAPSCSPATTRPSSTAAKSRPSSSKSRSTNFQTTSRRMRKETPSADPIRRGRR